MFTSDRAITSDGVGANLVEMLADLVRAIDGCTAEIARFNNWADKHGPQPPDGL